MEKNKMLDTIFDLSFASKISTEVRWEHSQPFTFAHFHNILCVANWLREGSAKD